MDFPYRNNIYNDDDRIEIFKNLIANKLKFEKHDVVPRRININVPQILFLYRGNYWYVMWNTNDYEKVQILSDLFNDTCRSKCSFADNIAPYDYYKQNEHKIKNELKKKGKAETAYNIREQIYHNTIECSVHNPSIIKFFISKYKAKRILDMSAGWGDRLLGALASGVDFYLGVDPNPCLHPSYEHMVELLLPYSPNPNGKYILIEDKFESVKIIDEKYTEYFDLLYSSPPYFDYEKYTDKEGQSHLSFKKENDWYHNFLQPSIQKCIRALKWGGYMVLYLLQQRGKTYMEKFLKWMLYVPNVYYMGCIHYSDQKFHSHPIFIYRKYNKVPKSLYNPKPVVESLQIKLNDSNNKITVNVFHDDYIIGGTKTRAGVMWLKRYLAENKNIERIIYSGAANGYAQVMLAYALCLLKKYNIELILVSQQINNDEIEAIHKIIKLYHPNTTFRLNKGTMKDLYPIIDSYNGPNDFIVPFGFHIKSYEDLLLKKLSIYMKSYTSIKRMWVVCGSGVIMSTLQKLLPSTYFLGVQVGRTLKDEDIYDKNRLKLYVSSYKFYEKYPHNTYINSVQSYDAKLFEFVNKYGQDGDYIWNVAGIHRYLMK